MAELRHSVCALDCPDACALLINVENGVGSRLRGDPEHPITRGFLCGKVSKYLEREYSSERLLYPMKRIGAKGEGRFERITWDEALDTIATRLAAISEEFGSEAILPYSYAGTMGMLNANGMDRRFFHRLGASRLDRTICSTPGMVGMTRAQGVRYSTEPEQFIHSKLILAWAGNIHATNVHLWPFIVEARRRGAKLYTIDPVMTRTGELADKHFFINPGSDLALALGMMHIIIGEKLFDAAYVEQHTIGFVSLKDRVASWTPERAEAATGIPRADIVQLAREYAATRPAVIRLNYGVQRSDRGASAVQAIAALPVLTGSWTEVGGGIQLSTSAAFQFNRTALERPDLQKLSPLGREARLLNMSELAKVLTEVDGPKVKAMVVYASNPAAIAPNQNLVMKGLAREDLFTVVLEQFQTDTADFADIVLPTTTFLEHTDLYLAYGHYYLQLARPVLPAPGECRSNFEIFQLLAKRMGLTDPALYESEDEMIRQTLASGHPFLEGITLERLERERSVRLNISARGKPFLPFANGGFMTPSGKVDLGAENFEYTPPVESRFGDASLRSRYPLEMVAAKNHNSMNSTFGNRSDTDAETAEVHLHREDAAARNIANGELVRLFNDRGSLRLVARVDGKVREGVVLAPSVRWPKRSPERRSVNALTSDRLTDFGGGPTLFSCLVQVEKCGD